jgi:hypothetical protein
MSFDPEGACEGGAEALQFGDGGLDLIADVGADFSLGCRAEIYRSDSRSQCPAR